jgi:multicomponent Na+:H+ antiporter subunit D
MPITMLAFTIGALSMIGLPPAAVLVSKWRLEGGAALAGFDVVVVILTVSSLLNALYYLPIVWRAFLKPTPDGATGFKEAPWPCVVAFAATAALTVFFFFFPDVFLGLAENVVRLGRGAP